MKPPFLIAEISANHNGSIERALKTIDEAKRCGADAVKIQTYTADTMTIDCDLDDFMIKGGLWDGYKLYDLYKWAETPYEWHEELFSYAKKIGINATFLDCITNSGGIPLQSVKKINKKQLINF